MTAALVESVQLALNQVFEAIAIAESEGGIEVSQKTYSDERRSFQCGACLFSIEGSESYLLTKQTP